MISWLKAEELGGSFSNGFEIKKIEGTVAVSSNLSVANVCYIGKDQLRIVRKERGFVYALVYPLQGGVADHGNCLQIVLFILNLYLLLELSQAQE